MTPDIDARLFNWGRAMRVHPLRLRCQSLEGLYRSPQRNHWAEPVTHAHGSVDTLDAWAIERAVITLPSPLVVILRLHYVVRAHPATIRRVVRRHNHIAINDFPLQILIAQNALLAALIHSVGQNRDIARRKAKKILDFGRTLEYKTT